FVLRRPQETRIVWVNTGAMSNPEAGAADTRHAHELWLESLSATERDALLHRVTVRQARLSLGIGAVFLGALLGVPLLNWLAPQIAALRLGGFTLTWLILGVLFYPLTWALSALFIRKSNELEDAIARDESVRGGGGA
ncbi:MAG: hypothetical protein ACKO5K_06410, partial [Armatimonadota bacterium]